MPQFSNGWLTAFNRRYNIKSWIQPDEDGNIDKAAIAEQLVLIQELARQYPPQDFYNCDETGIYLKMVPDRGLSTQQTSGTKKEKARIIVHFCCNADGSDKLPVWFIGKAADPRC